ncbi:MAG: AAA domain-containing protein [Deltaproteobacteria bacterium]|nr:AAA domain-containing protein [Deltaproteobacteria bacterium]
MASFLKNPSQANELFRHWKVSLQFEEALQKTLLPVHEKVAQKEGRNYLKLELLAGDKNLDAFLFFDQKCLSLDVDQESLPFLKFLNHSDQISKKYHQPIEHDVMVGFPVFFIKTQNCGEKLATLFKFPLQKIDYPQNSQILQDDVTLSLLSANKPLRFFSEEDKSSDAESSSRFYLDEFLLTEELGVSDEELIQFRKDFYRENQEPYKYILLFCEEILKAGPFEPKDRKKEDVLKILMASLQEFMESEDGDSARKGKQRLYPYALIYDLEKKQPTMQLQNDLNDLMEDDLFSYVDTDHPASRFLLGGNQEKKLAERLNAHYQPGKPTQSQTRAIRAALERNFTVVHGPPGTGKTFVIRNILAERILKVAFQLKSPDDQLNSLDAVSLVSSTNNRAVDNALEGLNLEGELPVALRVGSRIVFSTQTLFFLKTYLHALKRLNPSKSHGEFVQARKELEALLKDMDPPKTGKRKKLNPKSAEFEFKIYQTARKVLTAWAGYNQEQLIRIISGLMKDIEEKKGFRVLRNHNKWMFLLTAFPLVGSTLLSIRNFFPMEENEIGLIIIDEAGQCAIPYLMPALIRAKRAAILGDIYQLEPICGLTGQDVLSLALKRNIKLSGEILSYFSSEGDNLRSAHHVAMESVSDIITLKEHFRCRKPIIQISMDLCGYPLLVKTPTEKTDIENEALFFVDVMGEEKRYGNSWENPLEVLRLISLVKYIYKQGVEYKNIAILTPFRGQLLQINAALKREKIPFGIAEEDGQEKNKIATGTVHRFQGGERDLVLFSHVISKGEPRFLNSRVNLLNVAVSRAKKQFIFVGTMAALSRGDYTSVLKEHLIKNGKALHF